MVASAGCGHEFDVSSEKMMVGWHSSVKALKIGEASSGPCLDTIESVESVLPPKL
jgi:hypothetical protein